MKIESHEDHYLALRQLEQLMGKDPETSSPDGVLLRELSEAIENYERIHYQFETPTEEEKDENV